MNKYILDPEFAVISALTAGALTTLNVFTEIAPRWFVPGAFAVLLLLLMTAEIFTCYLATPKPLRASYEWEKKVGAKLLLIFLVIVSAILDGMILLVIIYFPHGPDSFPAWAEGFLPVTLTTIIWLGTAEAGRAILHVAQGTDVSNISPVVLWVIRQLRKVDMMRLPAGDEAQKRLLDNVTEEDITNLLRELKSRQDLEEPPAPLAKGAAPVASDVPPVTDSRREGL